MSVGNPKGRFSHITAQFVVHVISCSLLILMVQPQGLMFEVQVQGDVLTPRREFLELMCDCTNMDFGGVVLGQTS